MCFHAIEQYQTFILLGWIVPSFGEAWAGEPCEAWAGEPCEAWAGEPCQAWAGEPQVLFHHSVP